MERETSTTSTSSPLLDDVELLQEISNLCNVSDTFSHQSSFSTLSTDVCSPIYSVPSVREPVGLTPDEASELLKALDTPESSEIQVHTSPVSHNAIADFVSFKTKNQRRKPGRKKAKGSNTGKMRNPSRERLQNELSYLRNKVVEMEGQLKSLQLENRLNFSLLSSQQPQHQDGGAGARIWQRIALRQAHNRAISEAENRRLKGVLEGQIQLAQRLQQVLEKGPNVSVLRDAGETLKKKGFLETEDPSTMYKLFLSELDGLYAQTDSVFHQNGLETSVDDTLRHAYVRTRSASEDQDELYAELQDVNVLPFDLERVASAMWYAVKRHYSKKSYHSYQNLTDRVDDTIAVKYRTQCQRSGVNVWLDGIMVMRRYVEHDRTAIVWRSVSRGEAELSGMYTDETGWSVIKRIPGDAGLSLSGSVMQNCVHIVPRRMECPTGVQSDEIGLLTNLVIDSYEDEVIALSSMVEDLLLKKQ